jgi:hypothetical protein
MKHCHRCKESKSFEEFNKNNTKADGYQIFCRICEKAYKKEWYEENKAAHKKRVNERNIEIRKDTRTRLYQFYLEHPCIDCGESRPECLDLDHVRGQKWKNVSRLVGSSNTWPIIQKEIDKCEVRCANCHRVKTAHQLGWYSSIEK